MYLPKPPPEPGKWISAVQAAMVFALTMFALLWGVSFSFSAATPPPVVEQVSLLPPDVQTPSLPPPPKAEPKPKPKPAPKPKPKPAPDTTADADIALKQKQKAEEEKRRKEQEERERQKREEETQKQKQKEEEERKLKQQQLLEEERKREAKAAQERRERELRARQLSDAERAARDIEIGNERRAVEGGIRRRIEQQHSHPKSVPPDADIEVVIVFRLVPDATGRAILDSFPEIIESSGNDEYDESVYRAILQAKVFPFPRSPELAQEFENITLRMSPLDR